MARKDKTAETATTESTSTTADVAIHAGSELKYQGWSTTFGALGIPEGWAVPKALAYVIMNGFNQSMTDAAAFTKEQKAEALAKAQETNPEATLEDVTLAMATEARQKRFDAILSGTVGFRSGGGSARLPQIEKVMKDIALERIKAAVVAKGVAMPKGDKLKAFVEQYLAKNGDAVRAEAQTRIDTAKAGVSDMDLEDLLG